MRIAITRPHSSHSTTRGSRQTTGIFYRLDVGMTLNLIVWLALSSQLNFTIFLRSGSKAVKEMGTLSLQREEIVTRLALSLSTELIIFGLDNGPCHVYNIPATFPCDIQCIKKATWWWHCSYWLYLPNWWEETWDVRRLLRTSNTNCVTWRPTFSRAWERRGVCY